MQRTLGILAGCVAMGIASSASAQLSFGDYVKTLNTASTLRAEYTAQVIGESRGNYRVELQKPNLARIDTPTQLIVADGSQITVYNKGEKLYASRPQSDVELRALLNPDALSAWSGFFDAGVAKAFQVIDEGVGERAGAKVQMLRVTFDTDARRMATFYVNPDNRLLRQAAWDVEASVGRRTTVVTIQSVDINVPKSVVQFSAPAGANRLTWAEFIAPRWLTDIEQARKDAVASKKRILIDFADPTSEDWKKLNREVYLNDSFRRYASRFVLLRIDVRKQLSIAQFYQVAQAPTQIVVDGKGVNGGTNAAYKDSKDFYKFLDESLARP